jgi:hypothetical protein
MSSRAGKIRTLLRRDITQINTSGKVMFSADTQAGEAWMREQYGNRTIVFLVPAEYEAAMGFKRAAEAESFSIFVLTRRRMPGMW